MWCLINLHPRDPGGRENVDIRSDSAPSPSPRHHHRQRLEYPVAFALYSRSGILYVYIYISILRSDAMLCVRRLNATLF